MSYAIETRGLKDFEEILSKLGDAVQPSAVSAINDAAVYGRKLGSQQIRRKINFKANYLDAGRLAVTKRASGTDLEAVITGRDRATSLARFAQGGVRFGRPRLPPRVRVKAAGGAATVRGGFYMKLRRGASAVQDGYNVGLAVRLAQGERVRNKQMSVAPIGGGIALLYAPSVGQVYRSVAEDTVDQVGDQLANRFAHYLERSL